MRSDFFAQAAYSGWQPRTWTPLVIVASEPIGAAWSPRVILHSSRTMLFAMHFARLASPSSEDRVVAGRPNGTSNTVRTSPDVPGTLRLPLMAESWRHSSPTCRSGCGPSERRKFPSLLTAPQSNEIKLVSPKGPRSQDRYRDHHHPANGEDAAWSRAWLALGKPCKGK